MQNKGKPTTAFQTGAITGRSDTKPHFFTRGLVVVALGLFATAAALAVVKPTLNEPPAIYQAKTYLALPVPFPAVAASYSDPFIEQTQIRPGDTLAAILQRLDIQEKNLQTFLTHDKAARSIYKLYPGRTVQVALDQDGKLASLRYYHTPGTTENGQPVSKWLEVTPAGPNEFTAQEHTEVAEAQIRVAEGLINGSLFGATDAAAIPDTITMQMADILASKIDFMRDLRKGDRFRVVYESHTHDGRPVGAGRVLALEFNNRDKSYEAVWFAPEDGRGSYYDFNGSSLRGAFLRTALKFTRISSRFGMRKHPVHGNWRGHKGVDYAAANGTPIHATADGTIDFIGWQNGYGNTVIIKHHNGFSTLYAHQSSFAKGLKKGHKVEQGQRIGYVGATGWATGPHLHYEFRIKGKPVDPLSVDLPVARSLEGPELVDFKQAVASYKQHIHLLAAMQDDKIAAQDEGVKLASRP